MLWSQHALAEGQNGAVLRLGLSVLALGIKRIGQNVSNVDCCGAIESIFAIEFVPSSLKSGNDFWIGRICVAERRSEAGLRTRIIRNFGDGFFATTDLFLGADGSFDVLAPFAPAPTLDFAEKGLFGLPGHLIKRSAPAAAIVATGGL